MFHLHSYVRLGGGLPHREASFGSIVSNRNCKAMYVGGRRSTMTRPHAP